MKTFVLSASILVLLSACSQGRKQYKSPADQRVDQKADPADLKVPNVPSNPGASLVDGWYVDPTPEEAAAKISDAIRAPIVPTLGLAGVTTLMQRTQVEAKLGQPDFVAKDEYLRDVAVYGSGAFYIYYDRATKNKVEWLLARGGYTGSVSTAEDLKVGTDLAPLFAAAGGPEAFIKKLYQASHPSVEDCTKEQLCQAIEGQGFGVLSLSNTVTISYQDEPEKSKKGISVILITSRTPDAGSFQGEDWSLDLLSGTLARGTDTLTAGLSTWAEARQLGSLEERVEERDFAVGLTEYAVSLENSLAFTFERPNYKDLKKLSPDTSARITGVSAGEAFLGSFQLAKAPLEIQLCQTQSPIPQSPESLLTVKLNSLLASPTGELTPSNEATRQILWTVKVAAGQTSETTEESLCVSSPLRGAVDASLRSVLEEAITEHVAETYTDPSKAPAAFSVEVKGELSVKDLFDTGTQTLSGAPLKLSQALGKLIYKQSFQTVLNQAKSGLNNTSKKVIQVLPTEGDATIEDQQNIRSSFVVYDDKSLQSGLQLSISYSESSKNLYFDVSRIQPDFRNGNNGLSVLDGQQTIDLDSVLKFGKQGFSVASSAESTAELDLFDRSSRYAELDGTDPVLYAENVSVNVTDGLQSQNHIYDLLVNWNNLFLYGSRLDQVNEDNKPSISQTSLKIEGIEVQDLPADTRFTLTCKEQALTLSNRTNFRSVYNRLKDCGLFLTPGYATENVPSELHVAPEGKRKHGLTLKFTDGQLSGFMIYNTNSLSL